MGIDPNVTDFQLALASEVELLLEEGAEASDVSMALMCELGARLLDAYGFAEAINLMRVYANGVADKLFEEAAEGQRRKMH